MAKTTTKSTTKAFAKMTKAENEDFNLGKSHAWAEDGKLDTASPKYLAGYEFAAGIVNRLRTVNVLFAEGPEAELEGREAGMLEDRAGCTYAAGTQEHKDWRRGFNTVLKARIQHKQVLDNALEKDARRDRIILWRIEEEDVMGAADTRRPFGMSEEEEAAHRSRLTQ